MPLNIYNALFDILFEGLYGQASPVLYNCANLLQWEHSLRSCLQRARILVLVIRQQLASLVQKRSNSNGCGSKSK